MAGNSQRKGAMRNPGTKKGPTVGTGGARRKGLQPKGPTPKATERPHHPAARRERAAARRADEAAGKKINKRTGVAAAGRTSGPRKRPTADGGGFLMGRNSVVEALRSKVPATALFIASRIEMDERVKEAIKIAGSRGIAVNEITRPEMDRMTGFDSVHQGIALQVPPYKYQHPMELLDLVLARGQKPLFVALDGITDPRNLGAIIRSVAAFGGQGVILPQRRSTGVTASAWKTSAGAAARVPVALAANLNATLKEFKKRGVFVVGLDGGGDMSLPNFELSTEPLLLVVGSEGKGLSRLVTENCDAVLSIPIARDTESLNAGIAASVTLYEVSKRRAALKR